MPIYAYKCESCGFAKDVLQKMSDAPLSDCPACAKPTFQKQLTAAGHGHITTEILPAPEFYYAEDYHQQYLAKNPGGYCGLGGTGVSCPAGLGTHA